jgi:hypothetical protein
MPRKSFQNGYPLPASDLNTYLMDQSVMVFTSAADRTTNIATPTEGMFTYLSDVNKFYYYDGAAWQELIPNGWADKSANYSIVAGDVGKTIRSTGSAITVTVDNVLTLEGQRIDFIQSGTGQITFVAGSGVTLNSISGKVKTSAQYAAASVIFGGTGVYYLVGSLG